MLCYSGLKPLSLEELKSLENLPERIPSGQSLSPEDMFQQVTDLKREMEWIRSQLSTL